jgi:hypothetical protein
VGDFNFAVEWKTAGEATAVAMAACSARLFAEQWKMKSIPLVAVPYMGEVGQRLCDEAEVCWLDLSGNAHLVAPGLRLTIEASQTNSSGLVGPAVCSRPRARGLPRPPADCR